MKLTGFRRERYRYVVWGVCDPEYRTSDIDDGCNLWFNKRRYALEAAARIAEENDCEPPLVVRDVVDRVFILGLEEAW